MICEQNKYGSQDGTRCCTRCPAGQHVGRECDSNRDTECLGCEPEVYTDKHNSLSQCILCVKCDNNNQTVVKECQAHENRQCGCQAGFYCHDPGCEHCKQVSSCPPGQGVRVQATATNDTICGPCDRGMFSDVSDRTSPCKPHTSCEEQGRPLEKAGTDIADAVCSPFKSGCSWELPAGLWSGLVFTALLLFVGLVFWRKQRRSRKTVTSSVPADPRESAARPAVDLPPHASSALMDIHCQESCRPSQITVGCECCSLHHVVENGLQHETQPESTSFTHPFFNREELNGNGRAHRPPGASLDLHSEPQEDEWCGT